jgi:hypothetical protein
VANHVRATARGVRKRGQLRADAGMQKQ